MAICKVSLPVDTFGQDKLISIYNDGYENRMNGIQIIINDCGSCQSVHLTLATFFPFIQKFKLILLLLKGPRSAFSS